MTTTEVRLLMIPQPPPRVQRLIRQNDGEFYEATLGDMPLTGDWSAKPPTPDVLRAERDRDGQWVWVAIAEVGT